MSNTEVLVQLGTLLLLKAPKSFRKVIQEKIVPAYAKALGELRERAPDNAAIVLTLRTMALDILRSHGLDVDIPRRTVRRARGKQKGAPRMERPSVC